MSYRVESDEPAGAILCAEERDEGNYLARHWRGNLPLAQSYWVNGFLTNLVIGAVGLGLMGLEKSGRSLRIFSIAFLLYVLLFLTARIWTLVGVWRSAGRHAARGGSPGWARVAKGMIVLGGLVTVAQLPSLGLKAREFALIAVGRDPIGPMASVAVGAGGRMIRVTGLLSAGIADEFENVLEKSPRATLLVLDSDGGRIFEALRIAEVVRRRGLNTSVEEHCASACTLMLLAGKERSARRLAQIGFHQPDFPGISEAERSEFIAQNRRDYVEAGIAEDFIDRAMTTPPSEMWYPSHSVLVEAGVLTSVEAASEADRDRLRQLLSRMERDMNASRGEMLDDITMLVGARLAGDELVIRYQVAREYSAREARELHDDLLAGIRGDICDGAKRPMVEMGARFMFDYVDKNGKHVTRVTIDKCPAASSG